VNKFYHKSTNDPNVSTPQGASADNSIFVESKANQPFSSGQWQPPVGDVVKDFAVDMII